MTTDDLLASLHYYPLYWAAGALLALLTVALILRWWGRNHLSGWVTAAATMLGLGWSAQGMWDTAVHHYHQDVIVAWVLFVVFEAMLAARMLKARQYRADRPRRAKHTRVVWTIAIIMAAVVALGEGWTQAPARLAIPLLVALGWWADLTADDDPAERMATSWRWTPHRVGLALGLLEPGARDARTIDRDHLRDRLTRLAFREHHGAAWLNDLFRRKVRLQRLQTLADETDVREVRARLARSRVDLMAPSPQPAPIRPLPVAPTAKIVLPSERRVMGVHERDGREMRGRDLRADAVAQMLASMSPDRPLGMPTADLAALYTPPLGTRTAEGIAAEARKQINGHPVG